MKKWRKTSVHRSCCFLRARPFLVCKRNKGRTSNNNVIYIIYSNHQTLTRIKGSAIMHNRMQSTRFFWRLLLHNQNIKNKTSMKKCLDDRWLSNNLRGKCLKIGLFLFCSWNSWKPFELLGVCWHQRKLRISKCDGVYDRTYVCFTLL